MATAKHVSEKPSAQITVRAPAATTWTCLGFVLFFVRLGLLVTSCATSGSARKQLRDAGPRLSNCLVPRCIWSCGYLAHRLPPKACPRRMAANFRKVAAFREMVADGTLAMVAERARRRRLSLSEYRPPPLKLPVTVVGRRACGKT